MRIRQLRCPRPRRGDLEAGGQLPRIEIDRREIQLQLRLRGDQMKAADAMHLDQRIEGEDELGPATPLSRPQRKSLPADADLHRIAIVRHRKSHRNEDVRGISEQLVRRALNLRGDDALVILEMHDSYRELIQSTVAVENDLRRKSV